MTGKMLNSFPIFFICYRLPLDKKVELIPLLLKALDSKPASHQDSFLHMILPWLEHVKAPSENPEVKLKFLDLDDKLSKLLTDFLFDFMLLPYGSHPSIKPADPNDKVQVPSGLSESAWKRVSGETQTKPEDLEKIKANVVKFLGNGLILEKKIAMHLVIAMADTRHSVSTEADSVMRRVSGGIDWNEKELVNQLYDVFLGTLAIKGKDGRLMTTSASGVTHIKPENKRSPANTRLRLKLMPYLVRSREASLCFPASIQVIFDLLFGTGGNTNAKLKTLAVQFIHSVVENCPENRITSCGGVLLSALNKLVSNKVANSGDQEMLSNAEKDAAAKLRASCYVAIGKLGLKMPQLVNKDITIIQTFFEAMSTEDKETQMSVQEALSMMAPAFKAMDSTHLKLMEALLATYIEKDEHQVRHVAVQYAGEVFPPSHTPSKFVLLLGAGDAKDEVSTEAKLHLYGSIQKAHGYDQSAVKGQLLLPDFLEMTSLVIEKANTRVKTQQKVVIGSTILPFTPMVFKEIFNYLRMCLVYNAGVVPHLDMLRDPQEEAPKISQYILDFISGDNSKRMTLNKLIEMNQLFLSAKQETPQAQSLLQLIGCTPQSQWASELQPKMGWLRNLMNNTREDFREVASQLVGLVATTLEAEFIGSIQDLARGFKDKQLEFQHGAILSLAYSFAPKLKIAPQEVLNLKEFQETVGMMIEMLSPEQQHGLLMSSSCLALGELGRSGPLPLDSKAKEDLYKRLLEMMKSGKLSMKIRERSALALGQLCIGDLEFPWRKEILLGFLESARDIKDIELHFTIGEALVYATLGPLSTKGRNLWKESEESYRPKVDGNASDDQVKVVLSELVDKYTLSTHPNEKQASCIWLLALVKQAKEHHLVKESLMKIQSAFMGLLGDNNDLVQDAASKGLGLVYENCSENLREKMVQSLLSTLMEGQKTVGTVTGDTKLFDEKEMGRTPTGENLSTYRELCSLASDLNQPDLVYKFMHLANYNAMWNSRKGAAFGFGTIATKAGEQLEPHLPKIIPKLYRYQFDPTPKIQQSMGAIWNSLVSEPSKTIDKYLMEIVQELQNNLTSNQWRVRESCCGALQDLVRGRSLTGPALQVLPNIWTDLFRVMDDIKESVRLAAGKAVNALSRTCIRMCDSAQSGAKTSQETIQVILPPILDKGLSSNVSEVRAIALTTIVKITKSAGPMLKRDLPRLIPALLEATSEMESKEVNYISTRLANDANVQEKLDLARIAAAKSSSMMECVNYVLQFVDGDTLPTLIPKLIDLIKSTVGLGTKGTAAHVVVSLTHQCPQELQAYTGKILAAFVAGLGDRNPAVRKTFASSIGHLMKTAKDSSVEKLFVKLRTWYMEKDDESTKFSVAFTFQAVTRYNPDRMKAHAAQAMPLSFLAMHEGKTESNAEILDVWDEVWTDGTPGTESGIRLYLKEIVALLTSALESQQWKMKAQAARAMGAIGSKLKSQIPEKEQGQLLIQLIEALSGRTWSGKEAILVAIKDLICANPDNIQKMLASPDEPLTEQILMQCLIRECGKERLEYKIVALEATSKIIRALDLNYFESLYGMLLPFIRKSLDEQNEEEKPSESEETFSLDLQLASVECLGQAWPESPDTQFKVIDEFLKVLNAMVQNTTKKLQLAITIAVGQIVSSYNLNPDTDNSVFTNVSSILAFALSMPKNSQLRSKALDVLDQTIDILEKTPTSQQELFSEQISKSLDDVIKDLATDAAIKDKARKVKERLQAMNKMDCD